ncbi:MAG: sugar transferase [Acidimicrobiia bacterium]
MGGARHASARPEQIYLHKGVTTASVDLTRSEPHVLPSDVRLHLAHDPTRYEQFVKPLMDRVLAGILLVATSPLLLAAVVAIAFTMGRPILLRQHRVGRFGEVFTIYKLRTMLPDRRNGGNRFAGVDRRQTHKHPDDPRITKVGAILRKWSIDELPQLINVLRGDMSLVGPRPELVDIVARYEDWQHQRHRVKPGLTCIWQVSERGDVPLHEATEKDLDYVDTISFLTDLRLLAITPVSMFRGS